MSYLYLVTSQKATAVHYSIVCNFTSPTDKNLIIAKGNHIEIYIFSEENGLKLVKDLPIFGRVKALDSYRVQGHLQDFLFILIERKKFCILGYDTVKQVIFTKAVANVKERLGRDAEMGQRGFIDPEGRVIAMQLYDTCLKVKL